jgi:hypothetical protein
VATRSFAPGGYRYIPAVFQYSGGVAAEPGYEIIRVTFRRPLPLAEGFRHAAAIMTGAGRPLTAFCACELRSPAPFTDAGFRAFNEVYVGTLRQWKIYDDANNPVARSNVCPELGKPAEPSLRAFAYTQPSKTTTPTFIVAGSGEAQEGRATYAEATIAPGDTSPSGIRAKADWVMGEMERRLAVLGATWADVSATQVYTVYDFHPALDMMVRRGAAAHGLTWHHCRPPVTGLDFEMDCRGIAEERVG